MGIFTDIFEEIGYILRHRLNIKWIGKCKSLSVDSNTMYQFC